MNIPIEFPTDWTSYELIDSGDYLKLERFGSYIVSRPDPRAIWPKSQPDSIWRGAHAFHERTGEQATWNIVTPPPDPWIIKHDNLSFLLKPTEFKHVGVFPEQACNWKWITDTIKKDMEVLNLFAYTGGATMASLVQDARVTHVDSAKSAITWAHENVKLSSLETKQVRWIEEDAQKFVQREIRRGSKYDAIFMDPPRFGRGSKGEVWKIENDLPHLLNNAKKLLSPTASCLLVNAYTADLSSVSLYNIVSAICKDLGGHVTFGELALEESSQQRLLPNGIFARWTRHYI